MAGKEEGGDEDGDRLRARLGARMVMLREDGNEAGEANRWLVERRRTRPQPPCRRPEAARSFHASQNVVAGSPRCADPDNARHLPPRVGADSRCGALEPPGRALKPCRDHPGGGEARAEAAPDSPPLLQAFVLRVLGFGFRASGLGLGD